MLKNKLKKLEEKSEENNEEMDAGTHKLYKSVIESKKFTLYINDFANDDMSIASLCEELSKANSNDTIEIKISSYGGSCFELNKIVNTIKSYFYGKVVTFIDSHAYSAGAYMFLIGDTRIIYENSVIMFHDVSLGVVGKHSDVKDEAKFNQEYFDKFLVRELCSYFTQEEMKNMLNGKEFWLDAYDMCKREIATHVYFFGDLIEAKKYVEYCDKKDKRNEFLKLLEQEENLSPNDRRRVENELKEFKEVKNSKSKNKKINS